MRLRPSGRSGPLATRIDGFASYQENEAWTWEHMALTRARVVSASPAFAARVEAVIRDVLCRRATPTLIAGDVVEMRHAIAHGEGRRRPLGPQICRRRADRHRVHRAIPATRARRRPRRRSSTPRPSRVLDKAWRLGLLPTEDAEVLRPAVRLYHDLTQILRLCLPGASIRRQRRRAVRPAGARRRRARLRHARRLHRRDASQGARELRAHP